MRRSLIMLTVTVTLLAACGEVTDSNGAARAEAGDTVATDDPTAPLAATTGDTSTDDTSTDTTTDMTTDTATGDTVAMSDSAPPPTAPAIASVAASSDVARLLTALETADDFTSARMEGWITIVGGPGRPAGTAETMNFSGAFDTATQSSTSLIDFSQLATGMPGSANLSPEMADTVGELEIRTIGDTAYMRLELLASIGFPTPWVSMPAADVTDLADGFGVDIADPRGLLGVFALADAQVGLIGQEQVGGVATTHFRIIADVDQMLTLADPEAADRLRATGGFPPQGAVPIDLWIGDDDGFVHRFAYTVDGTAQPESGFQSIELGWELFDYGESIELVAPPADQVTDGGALLELAVSG